MDDEKEIRQFCANIGFVATHSMIEKLREFQEQARADERKNLIEQLKKLAFCNCVIEAVKLVEATKKKED